jgi:general secretion pathway protein D
MKQAMFFNRKSILKMSGLGYLVGNLLLIFPLISLAADVVIDTKETLTETEALVDNLVNLKSNTPANSAKSAKSPKASVANKVTNKAATNKDNALIGKLDFRQTKLGDVIRALSDVSSVNIVATEAASKKEVSVLLQNVTVKEALELVCKTNGLWFRHDKNAGSYRVMTTEEYQGDLVIYRDDIIKVFNILHPNPVIVATAIRDLYGNRVRLSLGVEDNTTMGSVGAGSAASATSRPGNNTSRSNNLSNNSSNGGGGATINTDKVVFNEKLSSEKLAKIETSIAAGGDDGLLSAEALKGFSQPEQPIYVTVNREHNLIVVRTSDTLAVKDIGELIKEMDKPTPQVLLEMKILSLEVGDKYRQSFDLDYVPDATVVNGPPTDQDKTPLFTPAVQNVTNTQTIGGAGNQTTITSTGVITSGVKNVLGLGNFALEGGTFVYQFMNDKIRARIQMLQEDNKINTLSSPVLLATNNKPSRVFVGTEYIITTGFEAVTGGANAVTVGTPVIVPVTEVRSIGNTLQIKPKINADGTVTLLIQQDSSVLRKNASSIPVPVGNSVVNFSVDSVQTSNIQGTVVAKDNLTIAIGGLIDHSESESEQKVPLLGDIPVIGELFKRKTKDKSKRELILLVTPHIITAPSESENVSMDTIGAISEIEY